MRRTLGREDGFSMIIAIAVLGLAILLGSVAMLEAVGSSDTANRDRAVKRALQAADAGVAAAIYRMNRLDTSRTDTPCVTVDASGGLGLTGYAADGWCPAVTEDMGNGASYTYRVGPTAQHTGTQTTVDATIVASGSIAGGTSQSVARRVAAKASALTGSPLFGDNGLISLKNLDLPNNVSINANTRSNGNVTLENSSSITGNATPGPGKSVTLTNNSSVSGSTQAATDQLVLAPVELGSADQTNGDDSRLNGCQSGTGLDTCSRNWVSTAGNNLSITNNGHAELGGNIYVFCSLSLSNSATLTIAPKNSGAVRIYIRAPDDPQCDGTGGNISMGNNTQIVNETGDPSALQIYVLGSPTIPTSVSLANRNQGQYVLFAPNSAVSVANNVHILGAIAAQSVTMANYSNLTYDSRAGQVTTTAITPVFRRQQYRECSSVAPAGSTPDDGC